MHTFRIATARFVNTLYACFLLFVDFLPTKCDGCNKDFWYVIANFISTYCIIEQSFMFKQPFFQQHLSTTRRMASSSAFASSNNRNEINERQCLLKYGDDKQLINYAISGSGSLNVLCLPGALGWCYYFRNIIFSLNIGNILKDVGKRISKRCWRVLMANE